MKEKMDKLLQDSIEQFKENGFADMPQAFDPEKCRQLLKQVKASKNFSHMFLSEEDYAKSTQFTGCNPRPGRNLAEKLDTDFIFGSDFFADLCKQILGPRYRVLDYKFVMGVPKNEIPDWLVRKLDDGLVNNLGQYVKPEFRDITYFYGIDYHQDVIDFPDRNSDFITMYIYLDQVHDWSSPLHLLPKTHLLGCTEFPHTLNRTGLHYTYKNEMDFEMESDEIVLKGGAGHAYFWHSCLLHGTQPHVDSREARVSLRILIDKNQMQNNGCVLDEVNSKIKGKLSLTKTRNDLDENKKAVLKGNAINR